MTAQKTAARETNFCTVGSIYMYAVGLMFVRFD